MFPVCTIRSTPTQLIHCVVWSKAFLFSKLFGQDEDDNDTQNSSSAANELEELKKLREESLALRRLRDESGSKDYAKHIFEKIFVKDIERLAAIPDMWKDRRAPKPLSLKQVPKGSLVHDVSGVENDHKTWSLETNISVFMDRYANTIFHYMSKSYAM